MEQEKPLLDLLEERGEEACGAWLDFVGWVLHDALHSWPGKRAAKAAAAIGFLWRCRLLTRRQLQILVEAAVPTGRKGGRASHYGRREWLERLKEAGYLRESRLFPAGLDVFSLTERGLLLARTLFGLGEDPGRVRRGRPGQMRHRIKTNELLVRMALSGADPLSLDWIEGETDRVRLLLPAMRLRPDAALFCGAYPILVELDTGARQSWVVLSQAKEYGKIVRRMEVLVLYVASPVRVQAIRNLDLGLGKVAGASWDLAPAVLLKAAGFLEDRGFPAGGWDDIFREMGPEAGELLRPGSRLYRPVRTKMTVREFPRPFSPPAGTDGGRTWRIGDVARFVVWRTGRKRGMVRAAREIVRAMREGLARDGKVSLGRLGRIAVRTAPNGRLRFRYLPGPELRKRLNERREE